MYEIVMNSPTEHYIVSGDLKIHNKRGHRVVLI